MDCTTCCPGYKAGLDSNACIFAATSVAALPLALNAIGQQRLAELLALTPRNWYSDQAKSPGGVYYNFVATIADELETLWDDLEYVKNQTRISTATECFLDLAASDFFGGMLQRLPGEDDITYRGRILANLLLEKATRSAMIKSLAAFGAPVMIMCEPWYPLDCGGYALMDSTTNMVTTASGTYPAYGGPGGIYPAVGSIAITDTTIVKNLTIPLGLAVTEPETTAIAQTVTVTVIGTLAITGSLTAPVDIIEPPFPGYGTWGNISRPYQAFMTVLRPAAVLYGPNILGYGTAGYTPLSIGWIEGAVNPFALVDQAIYCVINSVKAFGTRIWTAISSQDIGERAQPTGEAVVLNA